MLHKARLFFALSGTLFLAACMDEPVDDVSIEETMTETAEVQADASGEEAEKIAEPETTSAGDEVESNTDSSEETEDPGDSEDSKDSEVNESTSNLQALDPSYQTVIEHVIAVADLDAESFSFSIEETEEYVEISVREKIEEQAQAPLQGKYRYMFDTQKILVQDYLTGAFIPFEKDGE